MVTGRDIFVLPQVGAFLAHFGIEIDPIVEPDRFMEALGQADPRYQGGRNLLRFELEKDEKSWPEQTKSVVMEAAEVLRMLQPETQLDGYYDLVLVLGGARRSNHDRLNYAVAAIDSRKAAAKTLVMACSTRKLNEAEMLVTEQFAPGAKTEEDLCYSAVTDMTSKNPAVLPLWVACDTNERAGNPEVIETTLHKYRQEKGSRIAVVTTQIYWITALLDLGRIARRFGITNVAAAGTPSTPEAISKRTVATYLSEVLRTLRAATLYVSEVG